MLTCAQWKLDRPWIWWFSPHSHGCPLHDQVLIPTALLTRLGSKRLDLSSGILAPSSLRRERYCECFSNEGHVRSGGTCSSGGRAGFSTRTPSTHGLESCRDVACEGLEHDSPTAESGYSSSAYSEVVRPSLLRCLHRYCQAVCFIGRRTR